MGVVSKIVATYELSPFNASAAALGALCVVANSDRDISGSDKYITSGSEHFCGAGVCRQTKTGYYEIYAKGEKCLFTVNGEAYSSNAKSQAIKDGQLAWFSMKLFLATIVKPTTSIAGGAVTSPYKTTVVRHSDGTYTFETTNEGNTVLINSLSARDQFALQALRGMMEHMDDPSGMDDDKMYNYCHTAYKWAEWMMQEAANARAVYNDQTEGPEEEVDVNALDSNTEKILYNITADIKNLTAAVTEGFESIANGGE